MPDRFNGATAQRPWRTSPVVPARGHSPIASMGPRHKDRGELACMAAAKRHERDWLQWGHGTKTVENPPCSGRVRGHTGSSFNGATAQRPWRTPVDASMQPTRSTSLQWGHGTKTVENSASGDRAGLQPRASMGPRHKDRGEPAAATDASTDCDRLQWGHGTKTVENPAVQPTQAAGRRRFNGATAQRPWRTLLVTLVPAVSATASMGPRH